MESALEVEIHEKCSKLFLNGSYQGEFIWLFDNTIKLVFWKGQWEFTWLQYEIRTVHHTIHIQDVTFLSNSYKQLGSGEITQQEILENLSNNKLVIIKDNDNCYLVMKPLENGCVEICFIIDGKAMQDNIIQILTQYAIKLHNLMSNHVF
jgi:hypothetical protein